jgi:hypothetical protein
MIPRIVHQTSRRLTPEEARLALRVRNLLPYWEYRLWNDEENDALVEDRFPQYLSSFRSIKRGVVKADIARYMYMSAYGGFYLDTDYKLVLTIDDAMLSHSCILPVSRDSETLFRLGNAVFGSEPNHSFWSDFLERIFSDGQLTDLADFYLERRDLYKDVFLPPKEVFHPPLTYLGFSFQKGPKTIGAHLCWGSWRTKGPLGVVRAIAVRKLTSL